MLIQTLTAMSPSFRKYRPSKIFTLLWPDLLTSRPYTAHPLHATSWMDGLRALAALSISTHHILEAFINMNNSGPLEALCIFFVLGGYGASTRPLELMTHPSKQAQLVQTLSTSIFRRWFRLYIPTLVALLLTTLCAHFGAFESLRPLLSEPYKADFFPGSMTPQIPRQWRTMGKQLTYWSRDAAKLVDLRPAEMTKVSNSAYVWSVREEFKCSMGLYVVLIGTTRMKPIWRLATMLGLSWYALWCGSWEGMLFGFGAVAAQLELLIKARSLALLQQGGQDVVHADKKVRNGGDGLALVQTQRHSTLLIQGLGFPVVAFLISARVPGSLAFNNLVPLVRTYLSSQYPRTVCCGSGIVIFLLCMLNLPPKSLPHKLLNSGILQYIHRRAFGMVLLQTIVLYGGVLAIPHLVWNVVGGGIEDYSRKGVEWGDYSMNLLGLAFACLVNVILLLWLSDIFTKAIMLPNEALLKMLERWCFVQDGTVVVEGRSEVARSQVSPKDVV